MCARVVLLMLEQLVVYRLLGPILTFTPPQASAATVIGPRFVCALHASPTINHVTKVCVYLCASAFQTSTDQEVTAEREK